MLVTEQEISELQKFVFQLNSGNGVVIVEGKRDFNALRKIGYQGDVYDLPPLESRTLSNKIKDFMTDLKVGKIADEMNWCVKV